MLINEIDVPELISWAGKLENLLREKEIFLNSGDEGSLSMFFRGQKFGFDTVFTHNDLLSGNIMVPFDFFDNAREICDLKFIDYEYAGYNNRALDIANHFNGKKIN